MELDQDTLDAIHEAHQDANDFDGFHVKAFVREMEARGLKIVGLSDRDEASDEKSTLPLMQALLRIQKIAAGKAGHIYGSPDWPDLCDDMDAIFGIARNTIRDAEGPAAEVVGPSTARGKAS